MSLKTVLSLIAALLLLSYTLTLSTAQSECRSFSTLAEALRQYDLPAGLFPNNVQRFHCEPTRGNTLKLDIQLRGVCRVTREAVGVKNVVESQTRISATISFRRLTDILGVTFTVTASSPPFGPLNLKSALSEVRVTQILSVKFVQFYSYAGNASPPFPFTLFPSTPPNCDPSIRAFDNYSDSYDSSSNLAEDNQDTPIVV